MIHMKWQYFILREKIKVNFFSTAVVNGALRVKYLKYVKIAGWVANSVDPDQTPQNAASDLGLHCLLRPISPYHTYLGKYKGLFDYLFLRQ